MNYSSRAVNQSIKERGTDDLIGPYITMKDFKQLQRTHAVGRRDPEEVKEQTKQDRAQGLKSIYDTHKATDTNLGKGLLLPELYATAFKDLEALKVEMRQTGLEQQRQRNAQKLVKVQAVHDYFVQCLGDAAWKDMAVSCEWEDPNSNRFGYLAKYSCYIVQCLMSRFISAPSYSSKKTMKAIAGQVREVFDSLYEANFFSYSFLSEDDKWENALRQYAIAELPATEFMSLSHEGELDERQGSQFRSLIAQRNFGDAFAEVIGTREMLVELFVGVVHEASNHILFSEEDLREFARACYRCHWDEK